MAFSMMDSGSQPPLPPAYKGPRGAILVELKRSQWLTAKNLADRLNLSLNAVRHHLKELKVEGLIRYQREQRGVGAPTFAYQLSPAGESLFPQRYKEFVTEVLEHMAENTGRAAVVSALERRYTDLSRKLRAELADAPSSRRMEVVLKALVDGGFMAEWDERQGAVRLTEHNCAIRAVAERFPEVCDAEARFLSEVLAAAVEREAHILAGCNACEYSVHFNHADATGSPYTELKSWVRPPVDEEHV